MKKTISENVEKWLPPRCIVLEKKKCVNLSGIRQLQCILLKVALILGVEIHEGVSFEGLIPPPADQHSESKCATLFLVRCHLFLLQHFKCFPLKWIFLIRVEIGWRAAVDPCDHPVSQFEFDVLIGADGKRNTLEGFRRKEFRGKLAIAITANFINRRTEAEARVEEISGVAFIFNQKFFKDLYADTRIDLENIVYYKDDTHYFVMTAKKHSLIDKGVILQDYADTARLLDPANVDKEALLKYAKEAADFSTNYMLPDLDFAVNHYGQPDVAMFDFTSMYAAENASRAVEKNGHKLLQLLVGDSLLEVSFWSSVVTFYNRGFHTFFLSGTSYKIFINDISTSLPLYPYLLFKTMCKLDFAMKICFLAFLQFFPIFFSFSSHFSSIFLCLFPSSFAIFQ